MTTPRLSSNSIDVRDAFEAIEAYFDRGWSDGLRRLPKRSAFVTPTSKRSAAGTSRVRVISWIPPASPQPSKGSTAARTTAARIIAARSARPVVS